MTSRERRERRRALLEQHNDAVESLAVIGEMVVRRIATDADLDDDGLEVLQGVVAEANPCIVRRDCPGAQSVDAKIARVERWKTYAGAPPALFLQEFAVEQAGHLFEILEDLERQEYPLVPVPVKRRWLRRRRRPRRRVVRGVLCA